MEKNKLIILFILITSLFRLIHHIPNFTPVLSIALFSGVYFTNKKYIILPLIIMFLTDLFLGFSNITMFVYISIFFISILGIIFKKINIKTVLLSSLSFFVITNFGVWLLSYPKNISGLMECYTLAIPFFRNSLLGDLFYSGILYYAFNYIQKYNYEKT